MVSTSILYFGRSAIIVVRIVRGLLVLTKSDIPFFSILTWQVANSLSTVIFVVVSTAITKS